MALTLAQAKTYGLSVKTFSSTWFAVCSEMRSAISVSLFFALRNHSPVPEISAIHVPNALKPFSSGIPGVRASCCDVSMLYNAIQSRNKHSSARKRRLRPSAPSAHKCSEEGYIVRIRTHHSQSRGTIPSKDPPSCPSYRILPQSPYSAPLHSAASASPPPISTCTPWRSSLDP